MNAYVHQDLSSNRIIVVMAKTQDEAVKKITFQGVETVDKLVTLDANTTLVISLGPQVGVMSMSPEETPIPVLGAKVIWDHLKDEK